MNIDQRSTVIELVCALTSDSTTLEIARRWKLAPHGRASAHLDQYLEGRGDLEVDFERLLCEDAAVRSKIQHHVIFGLRDGKLQGSIPVRQGDYSVSDWRLAIGSMNVNWTFPSRRGSERVHLGFRNQYRWHPDEPRITQCVHQAADRLRARRARNYWMHGSTEAIVWPANCVSPSRFHLVRPGETLSHIARDHYRDPNRWREIHEANRARIPDPNRLSVGMVVEVPGVR
jgi:hypothetical protein